jgi:diadenosine tetraphosphate (Ap4A) HIT family hydrolase
MFFVSCFVSFTHVDTNPLQSSRGEADGRAEQFQMGNRISAPTPVAADARQPEDASQERARLHSQLDAIAVSSDTPNHARDDAAIPGLSDNTSVFGDILRGQLPAKILYEDGDVLCFRDIAPVSDHHTLVIPKRHIETVGHCGPSDVPLLEHMENVAVKVLQAENPSMDMDAARSERRLSLGYHVWPVISVPHLHLHCIYPMPCSRWWSRGLLARVVHPRDYGTFYVSSKQTIARLESGNPGPQS